MSDIQSFMTTDHRDCDDLFVTFENLIPTHDWPQLKQAWDAFAAHLERHFDMEEQVLFPEFESATGMTSGPTEVMRSEHQQMRGLAAEIEYAIENQDAEQCQDVAETLMLMTQQHNMKEEQMLYPMADEHVDASTTISSMQSLAR